MFLAYREEFAVVLPVQYRGTSLIRNVPLLGPYSRTMLEPYGGPREGGGFL